MNSGLINVKAVAALAGISSHTVRAWERRYQAITPKRNSSGRRIYDLQDIKKLKLLAGLTQRGHSIGSISQLNLHELKTLNLQKRPDPSPMNSAPPSVQLQKLISAVKALDVEKLEREFLKIRLNTPLSPLVLHILSPLMKEIGWMVSQGRLEIAQEHLLSTTLRNNLGEVLALIQKTFVWNDGDSPTLPKLLFTTPEGDHHEFGILLAALLAGNQGFKFRYLGPNMPAENLAQASKKMGAHVLVIGCTPGSETNLKSFLKQLEASALTGSKFPEEVWIGGGSKPLIGNLKTTRFKTTHFVDLHDFQKKLTSIFKKHGDIEIK